MIANGEMRRLLLTFLHGWSAGPDTTDFRNVMLDLRRDEEADDLCHRIAKDPFLALQSEPSAVTAILLMRIVTAIEISETLSADVIVIEGPMPEGDQEALSIIFNVLLPAMQLDESLDGRVVEANWVRSATRH